MLFDQKELSVFYIILLILLDQNVASSEKDVALLLEKLVLIQHVPTR